MPVTDGQIVTMRAHLAGDRDQHQRLIEEHADAGDGYNALTAAVLYLAARAHFGLSPTRSEVIGFVADVRAQFDPDGSRIDPMAAERIILAAVGDEEVDDLDDRTFGYVQAVLVTALMDDAAIQNPDRDLDAFLTEARVLADKWLA